MNPHHLRSEQGFTLLEILITMAVSAMVMTLIGSLLILLSRQVSRCEESSLIRRELTETKAAVLQALSRQDKAELLRSEGVQLPSLIRAEGESILLTEGEELLTLETITEIGYQRSGSLLRVTLHYQRGENQETFVFLYHFHTWSKGWNTASALT